MPNKPKPTPEPKISREIAGYLMSAADGELTPEDAARLERWTLAGPENLEAYVVYMNMRDALLLNVAAEEAVAAVAARDTELANGAARAEGAGTEEAIPESGPNGVIPKGADEMLMRVMTQVMADSAPSAGSAALAAEIQAVLEAAERDEDAPQPASPRGDRRAEAHPNNWLRKVKSSVTFSLLCGLLVVGGVIAIMALWRVPAAEQAIATSEEEPDDDRTRLAAKVIETHEAVWGLESDVHDQSRLLMTGHTLDLTSGWARVQFIGGATATLEGPTRLLIDDQKQPHLVHGRFTADVPPRAVGFTVRTPLARVVDLGTEFGLLLDVDDNEGGDADGGGAESLEVHVFSGLVATSVVDEDGSESPAIELTEGNAVRIESGTRTVEPLEARRDEFPLQIPGTGSSREHPSADPDEPDAGESGTLVLYDGFAVDDAGELIAGGVGWSEPWNRLPNRAEALPSSLTYRDAAGARLRTGGGSVAFPEQHYSTLRLIDARRGSRAEAAGLVDPQTGKLGRPGTVLWISFLGRGYTTEIANNPYAFVGFFDGNRTRQHAVLGKVGTSPDWFVGQGGSLGQPFNTPAFVVARIDFGDEQARIRVWLDCPLAGDPTRSIEPQRDFTRKTFQFDHLGISGNQTFDVDELRLGTGFRSVVPLATPSQDDAAELDNE